MVPEADAKLQSSAVTTSTPATASVSGNQIVTQIFKLNYESANNLLPVLRPLIAPNNTINVNPGNNSLVITDYAENMRRLGAHHRGARRAERLRHRGHPAQAFGRHRPGAAASRAWSKAAATGGGAGGAAPGTVDASFRTTLLAEPRSNALILRAANPARAQLVRTLIDKLDRAADRQRQRRRRQHLRGLPEERRRGEAGDHAARRDGGRSRRRGSRRGAGGAGGGGTAATAAAAVQQLARQQQGGSSAAATAPLSNANQPSTGGQIQADPSTNSLIITAPEPQYRQLRAVIDRLDGRRAQVLVESLIVEVNADKAAEFGIQWQSGLGSSGDRNVGVLGTNSSLGGANIIDLARRPGDRATLRRGPRAASTSASATASTAASTCWASWRASSKATAKATCCPRPTC